MALGVRAKPGAPLADINVTPMADIMIVLLIIFMVIVPIFDKDPALRLPPARNADEKKRTPVVVSLWPDTSVRLGGQRVDSLGELALLLRERLDGLPEAGRVVYLKADEALAYAEVARVVDLCREAGAVQIALLAARPTQG